MARKASQSIKDRLQQYKKTACRRSFFDALPAEAQQFLRDIRDLYQAGDLDLAWTEVHEACKKEFPKARWPARAQALSNWVKGEA
jgi:hypothetical protein